MQLPPFVLILSNLFRIGWASPQGVLHLNGRELLFGEATYFGF